jgi:serine protease Do
MSLFAMQCRRRWLMVWFFIGAFVVVNSSVYQSAGAQEEGGVEKAKSLSRAFRAAAHKVIPTVVKIKTITKPKPEGNTPSRMQGINPFQGTPFEDFFNGDEPPSGLQFHGRIPLRMGVGSGVIIDPSGIILTNDHVVDGADEVLVELADGRQLQATDIKTDDQSDLAVLRVKTKQPLPAASLGDSDALDIGDWVIAVGYPFELDSTVSAGIISGKGRVLPSGRRANYLQTDAAINPGNSGGPLVNLDGEVIGINTAIASTSGGYEGIGFAIPVNLAKWVTAQLIKKGEVQRAYLGVQIREINGELAEHLGVLPNSGVVVGDVFPNSPAATAGLHEGDIIVSFAGKKIASPQQLQEIVERMPAGSKQSIEILRNREDMRMQVAVQTLPNDLGIASAPALSREKNNSQAASYINPELGFEVIDLTPEIAKILGLTNASGVVITKVQSDSVAAMVGIRAGMVISRVGQKDIHSIAELKTALQGQSLENGIRLLIRTPNGSRFVVLQE